MRWPAWYSRLARNPRFQKTVMALLTIMLVWTTIELLFWKK